MTGLIKISPYILLFCFSFFSCSEKTRIDSGNGASFIKIFSNGYNDVGNDVKQTSTGEYVITGTTTNASTLKTSAFFIKTDRFGNIIGHTKTYGGDVNYTGNSIALTSDGGSLVAGTAETANNGTDMLVIKLDTDGNEIWEKTFDYNHLDDYASCIRVNRSGNYVVIGSATVDNDPNFGSGKDLWFLELDPSGNIVYSDVEGYKFSTTNDYASETGKYLDFFYTTDDVYMLVGNTTSFDQKNSRIFFAQLRTPAGITTRSDSIFILSSNYESGASCLYLPDNKMLVLATLVNASRISQLYLTRIDEPVFNPSPENMKQWYKGDQAVQYQASSMRLFSDGSLGILSNRISGGNSDIDIMRMDENFNLLAGGEHWFGDDNDQTANAFEITSDGGYIIVGTNKPTDKKSEIILIKTNAEGKVE